MMNVTCGANGMVAPRSGVLSARSGWHTPNPRLKPGAFKFDAFSILFGYSKQGLNRLFVSFDKPAPWPAALHGFLMRGSKPQSTA